MKRSLPLLILLAFSLALRILIFLNITPRIHTDSVTYLILSDLRTVRTPGYPFFIEVVQFFNDLLSLTPKYIWLIVFVQLFLLGLINCYLIYALARFATRSRGFACFMGLLYNLDFFVMGFEFIVLTETLTLTLLGLTILFFRRIFEVKTSAAVLAGLFSLWLLLTRPTFVAFFFVLTGLSLIIFFGTIHKSGNFAKFLRPLLIFLLINLVGVGAWSYRNKVRYDYFGVSSLLPFQLSYYTREFCQKYRTHGDEELDEYADILIQEGGQPFDFAERLEGLDVPHAEISRILMRLNLGLIKDNFRDYLSLLPGAAADYFACSWVWTEGRSEGVFRACPVLTRAWTFFLDFSRKIFENPAALLAFVLVIPAVLIVTQRRARDIFFTLCLLEGAVIYNTVVSVLLTNAAENNMRFRAPVEPFMWLIFFAALFVLGKSLVPRLRRLYRRPSR